MFHLWFRFVDAESMRIRFELIRVAMINVVYSDVERI